MPPIHYFATAINDWSCASFATLLQGRCLRFAGKRSHLNTPHRPVLLNATRSAKLLAQALLILLRAGLIADGAHLNDKAAAGSGSSAATAALWVVAGAVTGAGCCATGAATGAGVGSLPSSTPEAGSLEPRETATLPVRQCCHRFATCRC